MTVRAFHCNLLWGGNLIFFPPFPQRDKSQWQQEGGASKVGGPSAWRRGSWPGPSAEQWLFKTSTPKVDSLYCSLKIKSLVSRRYKGRIKPWIPCLCLPLLVVVFTVSGLSVGWGVVPPGPVEALGLLRMRAPVKVLTLGGPGLISSPFETVTSQ